MPSGFNFLWRPNTCSRCDLRAILLRHRFQRLPLQTRRALSSTVALRSERSLFAPKHDDISKDDILHHGNPSPEVDNRHPTHKTILSNRNALQLPERSKIFMPGKALGEPAHIIRISNSEHEPVFIHHKTPINTLRPDKENGQEQEDEEDIEGSFSAEELIEKLDEEANSADVSTIAEIDRVRKAFEQTYVLAGSPTMAQCRDVIIQLHSGFDEDQLYEYLRQSLKHQAKTWGNLHERYVGPLGIRSPWRAGVSDFPIETEARVDQASKPDSTAIFAELLQKTVGQVQQHAKGKVRAVGRILTEAWNIRPIHLQREPGEVILRLPKGHLDLMVSHKTFPLRKLERKYDLKVDFDESKRLLRLVSSRSIAMDAVVDLGNILRNIKKKVLNLLDLEPWASKRSNLFMARLALAEPAYLQQVREMTNTFIEVSRHRKVGEHGVLALNVYHFGPEDTEFEDVRRIILNIIDTSMIKDGIIDINVALEKFNIGQVPMDVSGLPLNERIMRWVRYRGTQPPRPKKAEAGIKFNLQSGLLVKAARQLLQAFVPLNRQVPDDDSSPYWHREPIYELKASIGQIAFPDVKKLKLPKEMDARRPGSFTDQNSFNQYKNKMKEFMAEAVNVRRSLITSLPGTQQVLEKVIRRVPKRRAELVVLLKPAVVKDSAYIDPSHVPNLELRILPGQIDQSTGDTIPAKLVSARLMSKQKIADVLLPINTTDIRYSAQQNFIATDEFDPALESYVVDGQLNKDTGGRFHLPSSLTLDIPTHSVNTTTTRSWWASDAARALVEDPFADAEMSGEDLSSIEPPREESDSSVPATSSDASTGPNDNDMTSQTDGTSVTSAPFETAIDTTRFAPIRKPSRVRDSPTVKIEYMLISIEHHSAFSANYSYATSQVHYSTVTAGKAGGRRTELSLTSTGRTVDHTEISRLVQLERALTIQTENALERRQAYRRMQHDEPAEPKSDIESQSLQDVMEMESETESKPNETNRAVSDANTAQSTTLDLQSPNSVPASTQPSNDAPTPSEIKALSKARQRSASDRRLDPLERLRREHIRTAREEFEYIRTLRSHCRALVWLQPWMEGALEIAGRFEQSVPSEQSVKPVLPAPQVVAGSESDAQPQSEKEEAAPREDATDGKEQRDYNYESNHPFASRELTPRPVPRFRGEVKWRNRNTEEERVKYSRFGNHEREERSARPLKKRGGHAVFYYDKKGVR